MKKTDQFLIVPMFLLIITVFLFGCNKEKERLADIEFVEPKMGEFGDLTWQAGDVLEFTIKSAISKGRMAPFDLALGWFDGSNDYAPKEIILNQTFESNNLEEVFHIEWTLPEELSTSSDDNVYMIIISRSSDRQSVEAGGNFKVPITIVENENG